VGATTANAGTGLRLLQDIYHNVSTDAYEKIHNGATVASMGTFIDSVNNT
jgi:hypothetical protein